MAQLKRFIGGYKDGDGGGFWTSVGKFFRSAERWINSFKGSRSRVTRNDPFVVITADQDKKDQNPYGTGHLNHVSQRDVEKEDEMSGKWFECFDMLMTVNAANETRKDILEGTSDFKKKMSNKEVLTTMGKKVAWPFLKLAKDQYVESKLQEAIQSTMSNDHVVLPKGTHVALTEELAYNQLFGNTPGGFRIYKIIGIDSIKFSDFGSRDDTMLVNSILKINSSRFKFIDQRK